MIIQDLGKKDDKVPPNYFVQLASEVSLSIRSFIRKMYLVISL